MPFHDLKPLDYDKGALPLNRGNAACEMHDVAEWTSQASGPLWLLCDASWWGSLVEIGHEVAGHSERIAYSVRARSARSGRATRSLERGPLVHIKYSLFVGAVSVWTPPLDGRDRWG